MTAWCICGRTERLGRVHKCGHPDGPRWSDVVKPHKPPAADEPAPAAVVANATDLANDLANQRTANVANASAGTYRYRDVEKRRAYMRNHMRQVRAKQKEATTS
jgi:hypothetical protein